jgi:hypothetical protein
VAVLRVEALLEEAETDVEGRTLANEVFLSVERGEMVVYGTVGETEVVREFGDPRAVQFLNGFENIENTFGGFYRPLCGIFVGHTRCIRDKYLKFYLSVYAAILGIQWLKQQYGFIFGISEFFPTDAYGGNEVDKSGIGVNEVDFHEESVLTQEFPRSMTA